MSYYIFKPFYIIHPKSKQSFSVNGGWSDWTASGTCSVTCGGGLQAWSRQCNNPPAANGGAACSGNSTEDRSCNTKKCPSMT